MPLPTADELRTIPAEHHRTIMEALADHFDLPAEICRIRNCRRFGACRAGAREGGVSTDPPCFRNLHPDHRATVDTIKSTLAAICHGILLPPPATAGRQKLLQENAIAIMRHALPRMPERAARFVHWYEYFTGPPTPQIDIAEFLREAREEVARGKQQLANARLLARHRR